MSDVITALCGVAPVYRSVTAKYPVEIWSDHKNLEYFMTSQKLTRRQARWSLLLAEYQFELHHRSGSSNSKADSLSRRPDHKKGVQGDNEDRVLLKPEFFKINVITQGHLTIDGETDILKAIQNCHEYD